MNLVAEDLSPKPEAGGGLALLGPFARGEVGMVPAGGFWTGQLPGLGIGPDDYDVQYFPSWATQRHQFSSAGYAIMKTAHNKDLAWEWVKFTASRDAMRMVFADNESTSARRSMAASRTYE